MNRSLMFSIILAGASLAGIVRAQDPAPEPDDLKRGVARISLINGDVSVRRGDANEIVAAVPNAPLMAQDRVITGPSSRAEIQFSSSDILRVGANAEVNLADLQYGRSQLQIARGTTTFTMLRDASTEMEIDTPTVSVRPSRRGIYRITVRETGESEITVRQGDVDIFTPRGSQKLSQGQSMMARGTASDPEFQIVAAGGLDEWDRWNESRDHVLQGAASYQYVSRDISGAEDLDNYGTWDTDPAYGHVWRPRVAADWAPYSAGRWVWLDWYGWTWVSYDPWGWAPYHYGRWYYSNGWCWYPGGVGRHYWSPALVGFFGFGRGSGFGVGFGGGWGNVGWVPLAPHERFDRWWGRSYYSGYRNGGFNRNINITNVNVTNVYRNARVNNGITAVNSGDFSRGRFGNHVRTSGDDLRQASVARGPIPAAPGAEHLRFSDRQVSGAVRSSSDNTRFFTHRQASQVDRVSFAEQRQSLARVSRTPVSNTPVGSEFRGGRRSEATPVAQGQSYSQAQRSESTSGRGGWRRFSDQSGSSGPAASQNGSQTPIQRNNEIQRNNGSRRFGEPAAQPSVQAPQSQSPQSSRGNSDSRGNWQRFGEPSGSSSSRPEPRSIDRSNNQDRQRGWSRFGDPGSTNAAPQYRSQPQQNYVQPERNYSRPQEYNRPQSQRQPNYSRPEPRSYSQPRYSAPQRQESIRMTPPVVRERSSGGGGGGGSARAERSSGGGGGHSRGDGGSRGGGRNR